MHDANIARDGGCRCGKVRFRITAPPLITSACHCTGCQRMTGSAFSLSAAIPSEGFAVVDGTPVVGGLHGDDIHHYFCGYCMSWIFTRAVGFDWFVNVRTTMLDDATGLDPFIETFTSEKLPWATTPATHRFAQFPAMEDYGELTAQYAKSTGQA